MIFPLGPDGYDVPHKKGDGGERPLPAFYESRMRPILERSILEVDRVFKILGWSAVCALVRGTAIAIQNPYMEWLSLGLLALLVIGSSSIIIQWVWAVFGLPDRVAVLRAHPIIVGFLMIVATFLFVVLPINILAISIVSVGDFIGILAEKAGEGLNTSR